MGRLTVVLASAVTAGLPVCLIGVGLTAAGAAAHRAGALARLVAPGGGWGKAIEVPGSGTLNRGGLAEVARVSCAAQGYCSAGGYYKDGGGRRQAFVVTERAGRWGRAIEVPGSGTLNRGGDAVVFSVSCAGPGDCSAGGYYADGRGRQAFVVTERAGRWGRAIEVPGSGALNRGGSARVWSVSCAGPGDCSAGGTYVEASGREQAFVVTERAGLWGRAIEVPGSGALNRGGGAEVSSVSCAAPGDCSAGGLYADGSTPGIGGGRQHAFVVTERNGRWGKAIEVPGSRALSRGGGAEVSSVSCAAPGDCSAGGFYGVQGQAFVVTERASRWGNAIEVPGSGPLNQGGDAAVFSVSCAAPGDCSAGGLYTDASGRNQAFVVTERASRWGNAIEVPGSGALNQGGSAQVNSVSCAAPGDCSAGGLYAEASGHFQAFVVTERADRWGNAIEVPGSGALNRGGSAAVNSVSCAAPGGCSAGGFYGDQAGHLHLQPFVASRT